MNAIEVSTLTFSIQAFVTLLVILDPPGATPIFLGLVADKSKNVSLELLTGRDMGGEDSKNKNIALVPLGTPLLAGPGAIVATMIFVQQIETPAQSFGLIAAVVAVHIVIAVSLMASTTILSIIKDAGVTLLARIAGLLLAAIAVQMLVDAIKAFTSQ